MMKAEPREQRKSFVMRSPSSIPGMAFLMMRYSTTRKPRVQGMSATWPGLKANV
jgi:hypothetical protein